MSLVYLETERFRIRQWELGDNEELFAIMSDSRVHTYTGDSPWTLERTIGYVKDILRRDFRTLEVFHGACVRKADGAIVGLTGLNPYLPKQPEIEWQFGVPFWGRGYASEIGRAVIREAFASTDIELIYGMANPKNHGSMKVMHNIGMRCLGLREFRGEQDMFYQITRADHLAALLLP